MPRSKFGDIYRDLKYKIESGEYPYQSLVPSENTLVAVYGCSRNTVRRALAGLIEAGYVQAIQGKGVRVLYRPAARAPFTLGRIESFRETARRCRTNYQTKVVHFSMTQTDGALAAASGFPPGADVYHVERVRIIDGRAMVLEVSYFLRSVVPTLTPEAAEQSVRNEFLTRKGIIKNTLIWKFKKRRLNPLDTAAEFKIQYVSGMADHRSCRISLYHKER